MIVKLKPKFFVGMTLSTSSNKGVPNEGIGMLNMGEKFKRIVNIRRRCKMKESAVKKMEVFGVVGWCCAENLSVYLLEFCHGRTVVEEREKMSMIVVVGGGGNGGGTDRVGGRQAGCGGYQHFEIWCWD